MKIEKYVLKVKMIFFSEAFFWKLYFNYISIIISLFELRYLLCCNSNIIKNIIYIKFQELFIIYQYQNHL